MIAHNIHAAIRAGAKLEIEMAQLPKGYEHSGKSMIRAKLTGDDVTSQEGWGFSIRAALVELEENISITKDAMEKSR